ncbi:hypothetical protein Rumeso_04341 [Rubellimicrobium mesophilum DSM 19309]|uniref:Uncharacterized protein n=1 Tax=Rubellimicrobium mesophilum DSM 19309 TaxID=442562 RepID=A0A017HIZ0_9RHOB|nr:hypothetical protein [Rubellimicrobium mesophilum]EYD74088.1 hypothetical protein Rumeso_04341 [Rubellimicrobium mesophilum DSM 19309]
MSAEEILSTCGARRDAAWLRAIRALSDAEFERLVRMQEEEDRFSGMLTAALAGACEEGPG